MKVLKSILAAFACIILIASYAAFSFMYYNKGIKLNEFYFISSGVSIAIFTGLLVTFFSNKIVRILLLYISSFYVILVGSYVWSWIFQNHAYMYIKLSLFVGLIIGLIYAFIDKIFRITNKRNGSS